MTSPIKTASAKVRCGACRGGSRPVLGVRPCAEGALRDAENSIEVRPRSNGAVLSRPEDDQHRRSIRSPEARQQLQERYIRVCSFTPPVVDRGVAAGSKSPMNW